MNKSSLILKYFQKADQLNIHNTSYQQTISSLFHWLTTNDNTQKDSTSSLLHLKSHTWAHIICREDTVVAGLEEMIYLLSQYTHLTLKPSATDGDFLLKDSTIGKISGNINEILAYERTILNMLQRMSGIASETQQLVNILNLQPTTYNLQPHTPYIAATRKTPWMSLDKKAVAVGGGLTHRLSLSDGILIKDNHIRIVAQTDKITIEEAIKKIAEAALSQKKNGLIEIETTTQSQLQAALKTFQTITEDMQLALMLDNFSLLQATNAVKQMSKTFDTSEVIFEGSGGIDKSTIRKWSQTGVDILSLGYLTHSPKAANLSLEL